jgi:hypothetical protein
MLLSPTNKPPLWAAVAFSMGEALVKAAGDPTISYNLAGKLYLSSKGWILLGVPNALVRGVFAAMKEPGIELPPPGAAGQLEAHVSVMRPEEIDKIGGPDKVTERGKDFTYTLGRVYSVEPDGWPDVAKVWYVKVHSPELQELRRSYGLSGLPNEGKHDFHITCAVRKRGVLSRSATAKG